MAKKMEIRATQDAWYKKSRIYEGQVVDYYGDTVPCWGTLASGEQVAEQTKSEDAPEQQNLLNQANTTNTPDSNSSTPTEDAEQNADDEQTKSEDELKAELETLRDKAVDNNIWIEGTDKMTTSEEIAALKEEFKAKKIEV